MTCSGISRFHVFLLKLACFRPELRGQEKGRRPSWVRPEADLPRGGSGSVEGLADGDEEGAGGVGLEQEGFDPDVG